MKTLGLIGGSSWVSTAEYYKHLNRLTNEKLGGVNAARLLLWSMNFGEFKTLVEGNDPQKVADHLAGLALKLETGGAEAILICANTPHLYAPFIQSKIKIPLLHIGDATALEMKKLGIKKCALLGTKFTMELPFMKEVYASHGIETLVPDENQRNYIHKTIFEELALDIFNTETKKKYLEIIDGLQKEGAEGIVLGCTEIPMLVNQNEHALPLLDTALIHSQYAVDFATK